MSRLIFDLGFHKGEDTRNYLDKGFNVLAVEGNPALVEKGIVNFEKEIREGKLVLLNTIISDQPQNATLYIHPTRTEWSSIYKDIAEQDGQKSKVVTVKSMSYKDLYETYDIPYYLKVDIEGCDIEVAKDVSESIIVPKYISLEINKIDYAKIFLYLMLAGYTKFQIRNQVNNELNGSGNFGDELPLDKWMSIDEALSQYVKYRELKIIDNKNLALGWVDLHAKL